MTQTQTGLTGLFAQRYLVERELGHGGTAVVYLARDTIGGQSVAIKVLRPEFAEAVGASRFLKEIRLNQRLDHPQLLPVLDSGECGGHLYFVLPHMEGGTLRQRLEARRQMGLEEVAAIMTSIASALDHAHEQGLIHRDVKPENILFTGDRAFLADFGIARVIESVTEEGTTSSAVVRGTPPYMSPEQASGERTYDGRSDIYSLASVCYEMIAGVPPYVGPTPQSVIAQKLLHSPPPLRRYRPGVPKQVDAVVARALSITPSDRPSSASAFARDLDSAIRAPGSPPSSTATRVLIAALGGAVAIAILATLLLDVRPPAVPEVTQPHTLAVLYFDDRSPDRSLSHVASGLTETLIDHLAQVPLLRVVSPNGVRLFRDRAVPLDSVTRRFGAGTVIAGSVSSDDTLLHVSVRMIDGATGAQLHSRVLHQPLAAFFWLQDTLASDVAFWLRQHLGRHIRLSEHRASSPSFAAWELVQRAEALVRDGVVLVRRGDTTALDTFLRADSLLEVAENMAADWTVPPVARARLSIHRTFAYTDPFGRPTAQFGRELLRAVELADRVLDRHPRVAEALAIRGEARARLVTLAGAEPVDSLLAAADRDLHAAVSIRADMARAWYVLGETRFRQARFADAYTAVSTAYDRDPFLENTRSVLQMLFFASLYAGSRYEAERWCGFARNRFPRDAMFSACPLYILGAFAATPDSATSAWRQVAAIESNDSTGFHRASWSFRRMMVAAILARAGMADSARAVIARTRREQGPRPAADREEAYVRVLLGEHEEALRLLRRTVLASPGERVWIRALSWYEPLHPDPRFQALVADR